MGRYIELKLIISIVLVIVFALVINMFTKNYWISFSVSFLVFSYIIMIFDIELEKGMRLLSAVLLIFVGFISWLLHHLWEGIFIVSLIIFLGVMFLSIKER